MAFLEITNVDKIYGAKTAIETYGLKNISLSIDEGEFVVLSGPSGSGKTTLLNMIGGLDNVTQGTITLDSVELTSLSEAQLSKARLHDIGFVFQAYNLISVLTAFENIEYVMALQGIDKAARHARVLEVAQTLGIDALLDKRPDQMSGGQQQRVAVARAVASKPKLILADEPTANLDSKTAEDLMNMMARLNEEEKITIIFSSHDPMVIGKAKRSVKLKDGAIASNERHS
ncbi:MAG: macrolide ABC transporter ATP-binding protein [Sulfuricurvum sp. PC08-66]|nr:MAG: macrolide ABC transporter ATP-binding protein [Sulfuricurvum sp. PC08-66]